MSKCLQNTIVKSMAYKAPQSGVLKATDQCLEHRLCHKTLTQDLVYALTHDFVQMSLPIVQQLVKSIDDMALHRSVLTIADQGLMFMFDGGSADELMFLRR